MPSSQDALERRIQSFLDTHNVGLGQYMPDLVALVRACAAPEWTRGIPDEPGSYLYATTGSAIFRILGVFEVDGEVTYRLNDSYTTREALEEYRSLMTDGLDIHHLRLPHPPEPREEDGDAD